MIVTDWEAAKSAIVEQRGQRLADDIEKLLRERDLIGEAPASFRGTACAECGFLIGLGGPAYHSSSCSRYRA